MQNNEGLIKIKVPGVSECTETEVDLMVLGTAAHATYHSHQSWGYVPKDDFGFYDEYKISFDLDVYISTRDQESELFGVLNRYNTLHIDYRHHAKSEVWQVRALVAMNGVCLRALACDPHPVVRQKVVEWVLHQHENGSGFHGIVDFGCRDEEQEFLMFKRFVPLSVNLGDISFIDDMITDEDEGVRYAIARMGITKHIDALIDDPSDFVRMAVANKGQERHLEHLINDSSREVLRLIVCNQNATRQQLDAIAHRVTFTSVLNALMERGVFYEFFIDGPVDDWVKIRAATMGYSHERLSRDEDDFTREIVAQYATDLDILDRLRIDRNNDVVYEAEARLEELAKINTVNGAQ